MTTDTKALHTEAAKLTREMHDLEATGMDANRLDAVYERLVELEGLIWGRV